MVEQPFGAAREAARQADGKFGAQPLPEAEGIVLTRPVPSGSFLYPPILHSAEEAIAFWESVEIPDAVLHKCSSMYVAQWAATAEHGPQYLWDGAGESEWVADHPEPSDPKSRADWEAQKAQAHAAWIDEYSEILKARPEILDPRDVRQMAKTVGLISAAYQLPEAEASKVFAHPVETTQGTSTARALNRKMGLYDFGHVLTDPASFSTDNGMANEKTVVALLTGVNRALAASEDRLRAEFGNVNDNIQKVAQVVIETS